jgi:hypothetical protein
MKPNVSFSFAFSLIFLTGCGRNALDTRQPLPTEKTSSCHKAADPDDQTFWVIEWKFNVAQSGTNKVNYYTFKYSPSSSKEPCKDGQGGQVCDHDVTTDTQLTNTCTYLTKTQTITEIVVRKDSIRAIGSSTKDCTCP